MKKKEKVLFLMDVEGIAKKGEIKEVGEAFAKNFLLPGRKALIYNKILGAQLQQQRTKLNEQQALRRSREEKTFAIIEKEKLTFFLREKDGKIFGSVTALDIVRTLKEKSNIQISKKDLLNFRPLHEKGEFLVGIKVGRGLTAKLQVIVGNSQENVKNR